MLDFFEIVDGFKKQPEESEAEQYTNYSYHSFLGICLVVQEKLEFQIADIDQRQGHQPGKNNYCNIFKSAFAFFLRRLSCLFIGEVYSFLHYGYFLFMPYSQNKSQKQTRNNTDC